MKRVTPKQAFAAREAHQALLELQRLLDEAAKTTHAAELESFHAAKRGEDTAVRRTLRRSAGAGAGKIGDCGSCLIRSSCRESEAHFLAGVTRTERRSQLPVAPPDAILLAAVQPVGVTHRAYQQRRCGMRTMCHLIPHRRIPPAHSASSAAYLFSHARKRSVIRVNSGLRPARYEPRSL